MTTVVDRMVADHGTPEGDACPSINLASTATAEVVAIPDSWRGKFIVISCRGSDAINTGVRFGTADTVDVSLSATTTLTSGVPTEAGTEPHLVVFAGAERLWRIDPAWTHFAHIEAATGGFFLATLVTGKGATAIPAA